MPRTRANSREELERIQLAKLRELLAAVRPDNAFYEAKLGQAEIDDSVASLAEFRANCPFTTKPELAADHAANPPYGSNLTFPPGATRASTKPAAPAARRCAGSTRRKAGSG